MVVTKNEEFEIFEGRGRGGEEGDLHFLISISIIIGKQMKILFFTYDKNRTLNEELIFLRGKGGGAPGR